ncbi:Dihydrolipoyllysine-residue succinyltransferase component of 2-oxoglutarate dehydrogenase complex [Phycisphaerae bacterium RAS1]|nr:Dihydrolipoyllysine-residue succinyltransferase component of 2-oxoglutarate dehydrogenase complex [Phycisphaerae bacterium RAS1]
MPVELKVPAAGESIVEVQIGEWIKKEGDLFRRDDVLVALETDKASMDVPAPVSGKITKILKPSGSSARVGDVIAHLEEAAIGAESAVAGATAARPAAPSGKSDGDARVMPAAQRLAVEKGVDARQVPAGGPGGRVLKEDVQRFVESGGRGAAAPAGAAATAAHSSPSGAAIGAASGAPSAAAVRTGGHREEEVVPMTLIRRRIAERLVQSQQTAALLTTFNEIDMSAVMQLRTEYGPAFQEKYEVKLGFMSFFVKAAIDGLKLIPQINAEVRGTDIVYKNYYDVGVAVGSGRGLIVPVIRNAERLSFAELEVAIADFGRRAKDNKVTVEELQGGTFTISNGGIYGSLMSTPIINPPQSGILGLHAIQDRPVARGGQVVIRPMMYVALTYDHRIVDGREAVTFLKRVKEAIETPTRMLLEV